MAFGAHTPIDVAVASLISALWRVAAYGCDGFCGHVVIGCFVADAAPMTLSLPQQSNAWHPAQLGNNPENKKPDLFHGHQHERARQYGTAEKDAQLIHTDRCVMKTFHNNTNTVHSSQIPGPRFCFRIYTRFSYTGRKGRKTVNCFLARWSPLSTSCRPC